MNLTLPHLIFLLGISVYLLVRVVFQFRASADTKAVRRVTARDRMLILLVGACQITLPLLLFFTPWLNATNYTLPTASAWLGTLTLTGGLWLFWRSHTDLGKSWSVTLELNSNHQLVTQGVYRLVRHPMYASFFAMAVAQGLLLNNWLAGWSALLAVTALYVVRVPTEEQMMLDHFGDDYRNYMRQTGGIFPRTRAA